MYVRPRRGVLATNDATICETEHSAWCYDTVMVVLKLWSLWQYSNVMYVIGDMFPQDTRSNSLERLLLIRSGRCCNHVYTEIVIII